MVLLNCPCVISWKSAWDLGAIKQELSNFFCKGSFSKYFKLCLNVLGYSGSVNSYSKSPTYECSSRELSKMRTYVCMSNHVS